MNNYLLFISCTFTFMSSACFIGGMAILTGGEKHHGKL